MYDQNALNLTLYMFTEVDSTQVLLEKKLIEEDCVVAGIYDRGYSYLQRPYVENYIVHPVGQSAEFKWTSINK